MATGVNSLIPIITKLYAVLAANPWILIAAAAVAAIIIIVKNWDTIKAFFVALWNSVISIVKTAGEAIVNVVRGYVNLVIGFWRGVGQVILGVWNGLKSAAQAAFSFVASIVSKYVNAWLTIIRGFGSALGSVWNFFKSGAQSAFNFVKGIIDGISRLISGIVNTVKNLPSLLGDAISSVIKKIPGGDTVLGLIGKIPGLAEGGPAQAGRPYVVGEQGPELFVPRMSGTVISNPSLAGMLDRGGDSYQITVVNPISEPASTSLPNALRRAGYLRGRS